MLTGTSRASSDDAFPREFIARALESGNLGRLGLDRTRPFQELRVDIAGDTSRRWIVTFPSVGSAAARQLLIKQYSPATRFRPDVANEFRGIRLTFDAFAAGGPFRVPEPYAYDPDQHLILMEYCPAVTLSRFLFQRLRWSAIIHSAAHHRDVLLYAAGAGALLKRFQAIPPQHGQISLQEGLQRALLRYRDHFWRSLTHCKSLGFPVADLARIRAYVDDRLRMPPSGPKLVVQHSDLGPWNLLLSEKCLYLADFHNFGYGFPAYDAAYFHTALDLWRRYRTVHQSGPTEAQSAFLTTFVDHADPGSSAMQLFRVFSVVHMTYFASVILSQRPRPRELAYFPLTRLGFLRQWFRRRLDDG